MTIRDRVNYTGSLIRLFELTGQYEPKTREYVRELSRNADLVVNGGAFNGYWIDEALKVGARHVEGFEPNHAKVKRLGERFHDNHRVTIFPFALTDKEGFVKFNQAVKAELSSMVFSHSGTVTTVPCTTLDRMYFFDSVPIDLLILDAEGAEPSIIRGAYKLLISGRIKNMIIEYFPKAWTEKDWDFLRSFFKERIPIENEKPFWIISNPFHVTNWVLKNN